MSAYVAMLFYKVNTEKFRLRPTRYAENGKINSTFST